MAIGCFRHSRHAMAVAVGLVALVHLNVPAAAQETEPVFPKLTPRLQELIQQEMVSILDAGHQILDALVMGDSAAVADQARAIERSFIMEQSMTEQDRQDLMAALPPAFVNLDRRFHQTAAKLAEAAENNDRIQAHAVFNEMIETCMSCHARFATDRFPGFERR